MGNFFFFNSYVSLPEGKYRNFGVSGVWAMDIVELLTNKGSHLTKQQEFAITNTPFSHLMKY